MPFKFKFTTKSTQMRLFKPRGQNPDWRSSEWNQDNYKCIYRQRRLFEEIRKLLFQIFAFVGQSTFFTPDLCTKLAGVKSFRWLYGARSNNFVVIILINNYHNVWKLFKMSHLNFGIFSPIFALKVTCLVTLFSKTRQINYFWHFSWTFVHSKCKQFWMRLFVIFKHCAFIRSEWILLFLVEQCWI